jgi:hypothetical protein
VSIALTDGTTFDVPLANLIDPSCVFAADIGTHLTIEQRPD